MSFPYKLFIRVPHKSASKTEKSAKTFSRRKYKENRATQHRAANTEFTVRAKKISITSPLSRPRRRPPLTSTSCARGLQKRAVQTFSPPLLCPSKITTK